MSDVLHALFPSETRLAALRLLFAQKVEDSVSGLARRMKLSARAVAREVENLQRAELLVVNSVGGADLVRANFSSPAARPLQALLRLTSPTENTREASVRESLGGWGAPLVGAAKGTRLALNETLLSGLELARRDGTVLRVLPLVLAKNLGQLDWPALKEDARRLRLKAELGMLVDLTADLLQRDELRQYVADLQDRRRRRKRFFPEPRSRFEKELAKRNTPPAAAKWGFWMNMTEDAFKATLQSHLA